MKVNLSLNLPKPVREKAESISQGLSEKFDSHFLLGKNSYPHVTVYAADFSEDAIPSAQTEIEKISLAQPPVEAIATKVETHQGYIGVELERSKEILEFHNIVVKALAPLRMREGSDGDDYNMDFTVEQIENIETYGYADAGDLYKPHFTLNRLKSVTDAEKATAETTWDIGSFTIDSIGLYFMGEHGTCTELLLESSLKGLKE